MLFRFMAVLFGGVLAATAAQLNLDWSGFALDQSPTDFVSVVSGEGQPGDWRIVMDDVPSGIKSFNPEATVPRRAVLAQTAGNLTDEHFPALIYQGETFADFTLKTRFKLVSGLVEKMAGIVFRYQDPKNYYVIRASGPGNNLRFYKFVDGQRTPPIGPDVPVSIGEWHEMVVTCEGNRIRASLDGKPVMPELTDNSFAFGRIGFWTKSDSVSHFVDTVITYKPRESAAAVAARDLVAGSKSVLHVKLYRFQKGDTNAVSLVASDDLKEVGQSGGNSEADVLLRGNVYYAKGKDRVELIVPIRDNNGEVLAAARITMTTFAGQTEDNALARVAPFRQELELRLRSVEDWE
jgi:hypothetical protein